MAAEAVGLADTAPGSSTETATPAGCYVRDGHLFFNPNGDPRYADTDRVSLCRSGTGIARLVSL